MRWDTRTEKASLCLMASSVKSETAKGNRLGGLDCNLDSAILGKFLQEAAAKLRF